MLQSASRPGAQLNSGQLPNHADSLLNNFELNMATPRKPPESLLKRVPGHVKRRHYACRLRDDYHAWLLDECKRLRCSQGVFLELLLAAHMRQAVVTADDVFTYDSEERRIAVTG